MSCTGQSELIYVCLKIKLSASKSKSKFNIGIVLITEFTDAVGQRRKLSESEITNGLCCLKRPL